MAACWSMPKFYQKFSYLFEVDSFGDSSHDYTGPPSEQEQCFNQSSNVYTLNGGSLKVVDKFTYLGSSV